MKKFILAISSFCLFINWSGQDSSVQGRRKHNINFYGTLVTNAGTILKVENISIAHLYKQIPVYELPSSNQLNTTKNMLISDPRTGIVTKIDLSEISEITVPYPDKIYFYKKKKGYRKIEFVQIDIYSADAIKTKHSYLIDLKRKLICDEVNGAGPIEKDIPLTAIKSLKIEGYNYRDIDKTKKTTKPTSASPGTSYYNKEV